MTITVAIVDDHPLLVEGVKRRLELASDVDVVATGSSGECFEEIVASVRPDVVLLDLSLPEQRGTLLSAGGKRYRSIRALKAITASETAPQIIVLSSEADPAVVARTIDMGAAGYIVKDDIASLDLGDFVRRVAAGEMTLSREAHKLARQHRLQSERGSPETKLSPAEQRVAHDLVSFPGDNLKARALRLNNSPNTIKHQLGDIFRKLQVSNVAAAVAKLSEGGNPNLYE